MFNRTFLRRDRKKTNLIKFYKRQETVDRPRAEGTRLIDEETGNIADFRKCWLGEDNS